MSHLILIVRNRFRTLSRYAANIYLTSNSLDEKSDESRFQLLGRRRERGWGIHQLEMKTQVAATSRDCFAHKTYCRVPFSSFLQLLFIAAFLLLTILCSVKVAHISYSLGNFTIQMILALSVCSTSKIFHLWRHNSARSPLPPFSVGPSHQSPEVSSRWEEVCFI